MPNKRLFKIASTDEGTARLKKRLLNIAPSLITSSLPAEAVVPSERALPQAYDTSSLLQPGPSGGAFDPGTCRTR
ncbi:MAG: hypothetical protein ABI670_00010 [Chloroflexota bacterium]